MLIVNSEFVKRRLHKNRGRKQKPRSMAELAAMMETEDSPPSTATYLYSVLRGERDVKLSYVHRMADALGVSYKDLLVSED